jgi:hypothetical protein
MSTASPHFEISQSDVPWGQGEKASPGWSGDDVSAFDPDSWLDEPDQPDLSGRAPDSTKQNGTFAQDRANSSGLRDEDKGFEI